MKGFLFEENQARARNQVACDLGILTLLRQALWSEKQILITVRIMLFLIPATLTTNLFAPLLIKSISKSFLSTIPRDISCIPLRTHNML